ncbi:MAG: ATP-dependent protease ATPase subunit HslU [Bacteroidetes bacterium]|nr:ATP-dependent protease ATPase subunit HslU [Bacteroidota bacterium]
MKNNTTNLTPIGVVEILDKYIIGQSDAKRNVAIALRNRWRRMNVKSDIKGDIMPNNILMIGSTGVGKTEIARRLAKITGSPFVKVEASKFTEVGYVGRDVESMIRDLVERSVGMVTERKKEEVREKAIQKVEDIILDKLVPPLVETKIKPSRDITVMPEEVEKNNEEKMQNAKTREYYRQKLKNGELEKKKIEIEISKGSRTNIGFLGGGMIDEVALGNLQEALSNMMSPSSNKRIVTIEEARKLLLDEEASKMVDMEAVKEEAITKTQNTGIIFIDEIDKIAASSAKGGAPDVSREGVQRDLLPIVEGSAVNTKYGTVNTDHILFIAAGAFHVSKPSDLIPELQGRFPIRVELDSLTKNDFKRILKEPKNSLTKQYIALFEAENVKLEIKEDAIEEIAETAFKINQDVENIGARRLHTVMSHILNEYMFDVPGKIKPNEKISIDKKFITTKLDKLIKNKDLSEYIL